MRIPGHKIGRALPVCSFALICNATLAAAAGNQNPAVPSEGLSEPVMEVLATSLRSSGGGLQHRPALPETPIEIFPVDGLPLGIGSASLARSRTGRLLQLSVSNNSDEPILGIRYWLLIVDSENQLRRALDQSEGLRLDAYATKGISFSAPSRLKIGSNDRVFMVVAQVIGRESIWEVRRARESLLDFVKGAGYTMPSVLRVLNQVDAPLGLSPIFLRQKQ